MNKLLTTSLLILFFAASSSYAASASYFSIGYSDNSMLNFDKTNAQVSGKTITGVPVSLMSVNPAKLKTKPTNFNVHFTAYNPALIENVKKSLNINLPQTCSKPGSRGCFYGVLLFASENHCKSYKGANNISGSNWSACQVHSVQFPMLPNKTNYYVLTTAQPF